jgi:hypothetical protein
MLSEIETFVLNIELNQALGTILYNVDHHCRGMIRDCTSAKKAWDSLKEELEGKEIYTKIYLLQLLYNTCVDEESLERDAYLKHLPQVR